MVAKHLELLVKVGVGDFLDGFLYRQALIVAEFDIGTGRELHRKHEIFAVLAGDDIVIDIVDGRHFFFLERFVGGVFDENFRRLVHKRLLADVTLDDLHRRLALSEAGDAHAIGETFGCRFFSVGEFGGVDLDRQLHQIVIQRFLRDIHQQTRHEPHRPL